MMNNPLSFYLHIPFCEKKCNYCAFYSLESKSETEIQSYTQGLIKHITSFETNRPIQSIYFGGGTPSIIGANRLIKILDTIKDKFVLSEDCEITVEINPKSISQNQLLSLRTAGVNRLSVGMQSTNDNELNVLGRRYTALEFDDCIKGALSAGFGNISLDIIFGLPDQTKDTLLESLKYPIKSDIPHVSVYELSIEKGTPFYRRKDDLNLPDEDLEEELYSLVCDTLKDNGYIHYEVSSFSKKGFESKHNLHYWLGGEYIGFGSGAHSFYNGKRFSGVANTFEYLTRLNEDFYSPTDYYSQPILSDKEIAEEQILLGLRTNTGVLADEALLIKAKKYIESGYAEINNNRLSLTSKGYRVSNSIIVDLLI